MAGPHNRNFISPWLDAKRREDGTWSLPEYPCEIRNVAPDDPRNKRWIPGEYQDGIDNATDTSMTQTWSGQKLWDGDQQPLDWDVDLPANVRRLAVVPHMPNQPMKEYFARLKALEPRHFSDRHFDDIFRNLPDDWVTMRRCILWAESFGIHTQTNPAEWAGQEKELLPAVYTTPRPNTVTICVGVLGSSEEETSERTNLTEYDYLEFLFAKDQEGRIIQVYSYPPSGACRNIFSTYSFIPPMGTTSITPFACFKLRGVWQGDSLEWDPRIKNEDMQWFTEMSPQLRNALVNKKNIDVNLEPCSSRRQDTRKTNPVLWPDNSWQGNVAKARMWDELQKTPPGNYGSCSPTANR